MLIAAALILLLVDVVIVLLLAPLPKEACEKQATQAPAAHNAPADQQASKTMLVAALVLFLADVIVPPPRASRDGGVQGADDASAGASRCSHRSASEQGDARRRPRPLPRRCRRHRPPPRASRAGDGQGVTTPRQVRVHSCQLSISSCSKVLDGLKPRTPPSRIASLTCGGAALSV